MNRMKWVLIVLSFAIIAPIEGRTYYDVLGISKNATQQQITNACNVKEADAEKRLQVATQAAAEERAKLKKSGRKKSKELDKLEDNVRNIRTEQILREDACETLGKPTERKKYDALPRAEQEKKVAEQEELQRKAKTDIEGIALDSIEKKRLFIQEKIDRGGHFNITRLIGDYFRALYLPGAARAIFNEDAVMYDVRFVPGPKGLAFRDSLGFTGTLHIKDERLRSTIYIIQDNNFNLKYSWKIDFPHGKTIADIFPKLKPLEMLKLPEPALIVSNFSYLNPGTVSFPVDEGITLEATLSLTGPLQLLKELIDKAAKTKAIIARIEPIAFYGAIPFDVVSASFGSIIPLRLGIDFTKIPRLPKDFTKVFKELTTDDFKFSVGLSPEVQQTETKRTEGAQPAVKKTEVRLSLEAGIRLVLGTQKEPLRFTSIGEITPSRLTLGRRIRNLDLGIIEINNVTTTVDIDRELVKVTILIGCPITGIGFLGIISVGKKDEAIFTVGGGLSFKSDGAPTFVLDLGARNIKFADIVALLFKMAEKAGVKGVPPVDKIPTMTVERARGYVALDDTVIAGKEYKAGFALQFEADLFDKRFGFNIDIQFTDLIASGFGYLPPIDIKANGRTVFLLTGPGIDVAGFEAKDRGAAVKCTFDVKNPLNSKFQVGAILEIPDLAVRQVVKLILSKTVFRADFESRFPGFSADFEARLDPLSPEDLYVRFKFKNDINELINKQVRWVLEELKKASEEKLAEADRKIAKSSEAIKRAQAKGIQKLRAEIIRVQNQIQESSRTIKKLQRDCETVPIVNIAKKIAACAKASSKIDKEGARLKGYEIYLNTALAAGAKIIKETTGVAAATTKALGEAKVLKKTVQGTLTGISAALREVIAGVSIITIKEAEGEFGTQDVIHARFPKLITFVAEIKIPRGPTKRISLKNLQFDFKEPAKTAGEIVKQLLREVKIGI